MSRVVMLAMALLIGAGLALQSGTNAQLRLFVGSPFRSALVNFTVGGVLMALLSLLTPSDPAALRHSAWWMWIGGVLGAAFVTGSVVLQPRLGATTLFAAIIAGQLTMAVAIDQFGLIGSRVQPVTWTRAIGIALLIAGVVLVQRR